MTFYGNVYDAALFGYGDFYGLGGLNGYRYGSPYGYRSFGSLYGNRGLLGYGGYYGYGDLDGFGYGNLYGFGYGYPFSRFGGRYYY